MLEGTVEHASDSPRALVAGGTKGPRGERGAGRGRPEAGRCGRRWWCMRQSRPCRCSWLLVALERGERGTERGSLVRSVGGPTSTSTCSLSLNAEQDAARQHEYDPRRRRRSALNRHGRPRVAVCGRVARLPRRQALAPLPRAQPAQEPRPPPALDQHRHPRPHLRPRPPRRRLPPPRPPPGGAPASSPVPGRLAWRRHRLALLAHPHPL